MRRILPGFKLTLGFTLFYLSFIVLIPLSTILIKTAGMSWGEFAATVASPRSLAAYRLSLTASLGAALINLFFGTALAWVLVRYDLPFKKFIDGLVDLPFALPTAVAGIAMTALYADNGWIGRYTHLLGIRVAYTELGILLVLTFIGLPFIVRTLQPVVEELDSAMEEAAASLGAGRWQIIRRVIGPELLPALLTGFMLAFARCLGEYGSVIFIAGNLPMKTEVTPLLIMIKLEQFDYAGATAIALVFLAISFTLLLAANLLQRRLAVARETR